VVGDGEDRARVALRQLPALEHREHVLRQLEQAHPVRDSRLRLADPLGHVPERECELVHQDCEGARLLDGGQVLARDVLDQAEQQRLAVVRLADHGRHLAHAGFPGRAPAPFAGDQLVAAGGPRPDDDRLHHALAAHGLREPCPCLRVEPPPRLARARVDRVDGQLC
jgi:hypothetical protein